MNGRSNPPALHRPMMVVSSSETLLAESLKAQLVDDVTQIIQRVRFVECAPARLWEPGLVSELDAAVAKLNAKLTDLKGKIDVSAA